jgi:hypothetical protein
MSQPSHFILDVPKDGRWLELKERAPGEVYKMHDPTHIEHTVPPNMTDPDWRYVLTASQQHRRLEAIKEGGNIRFKAYEGTPPVDAKLTGLVYMAFNEILQQNGMAIDTIYRSAINFTPQKHGKPAALPHIDLPVPHLVMILYLNTTSGATHICEDLTDDNNGTWQWPTDQIPPERMTLEEATIEDSITPEEGKAILFDGRRFHFNDSPEAGDPNRLVVIANLTLRSPA